jgi:hypothetical protein
LFDTPNEKPEIDLSGFLFLALNGWTKRTCFRNSPIEPESHSGVVNYSTKEKTNPGNPNYLHFRSLK